MKRLISIILTATLIVSSGIISLIYTGAVSNDLVANGSFEDGMSPWGVSDGGVWNVTDETAATGSKSIKANGGSDWLYNKMTLEANVSYKLTFKIKGAANWMNYGIGTSQSNRNILSSYVSRKADDWTDVTSLFKTGDATEYYVSFYGEADSVCYIDDVTVEKVFEENGIVTNGSFEYGMSSWGVNDGGVWDVTDEAAATGSKSIKVNGGSDWLYNKITLEANTSYTLTFKMLGTVRWMNYGVGTSPSNRSVLSQGFWKQIDNWEIFTAVFDTTEATEYYVSFYGENTTCYIDDVVVTKNGGEKPIVTNGSFEYALSGWTAIDNMWTVTDKYAATGSKSVKGALAWFYQRVELEPNTEYSVSFKVNKSVNWLNYGISTAENDYSYNSRNILASFVSGIYSDWHTVRNFFTTGDGTDYYIAFYDESTESYIDDVEIKKVEIKDTGIVKNADFSRGLKEWTHTNWVIAADGDNTCAMIASNSAPWISQDVTLESGKLYKFTFDYKGTQYWAQYKLTQKESGKQIFGGLYTTSDDWKTITVYFIAPESGIYTVAFDDEDTAPTYIDNVYITDSDISAGDIDENGSVENTDLVLLKKLLLGVGEENVFADVNCDGNIDIKDLISLKKLLAK